jgi:hypothetical protein
MSNHTPGAQPARSAGARTLFRILGVLVMGAAITLIAIAFADLMNSDFHHEPTKFWMAFVGIPLFAVGGFLLNLGFGGVHAKYMADEYSPAIQSVARDIGLRDDASASGPYCRSCGTQNDQAARFCDGCGTSMSA